MTAAAPDTDPATAGPQVARMLEARSIAVVGASDRPGSFGLRMTTEALRSSSAPTIHLVHPAHREVLGHPCVPSLDDVPEPVDLVLLGVPDHTLVDLVTMAASRGDGGAVIFGTAAGLGDDLVAAAGGLAVCGGGCMGFVNVAGGVRAIGYLERHPLPAGPIAFVTHSGSVFSALLRTHRRLEYSLIVSSGQELVTTTADYLQYSLSRPETRVVGLFMETLRDVPRLRQQLAIAAERDVPVVALTVGGSPTGRTLVDAHSGAIAGDDAAWEALFAAYGVHRVDDLGELADSLEAFAVGRRVRPTPGRGGIATVHDSGAERVLVADVATRLRVPFAEISGATRRRLEQWLAPGLLPANPLDVWSNGANTERVFTECLAALADDPAVSVVALAVDFVPEYDGDESFPAALETVRTRTDKPVVALTTLASAVDQAAAARLRAQGIPVLEGTRSGLRALGHLLRDPPPPPTAPDVDEARRRRWMRRFERGPLGPETLTLLSDYGIAVEHVHPAESADEAVAVAERLGYPVVLKTANPAIHHKVDVEGVRVGLADTFHVRAAYTDLVNRLGPRVVVQRQVPEGVELATGLVRDPLLGPLVVLAAGGTLIEVLDQRRVALPPVGAALAGDLLDDLAVARLLSGVRGRPAVDPSGVVAAVLAVSQVAVELGHVIDALDVNPLIVSRQGAVAVDALVVPRH